MDCKNICTRALKIMASHMPDVPDELPQRIVRSEKPDSEERRIFMDAAKSWGLMRVPSIFSHFCPSFSGKGKLLDIGCGTGEYTFAWGLDFPRVEVTGVDLCEEYIEIAMNAAHHLGVKATFIAGRLPGALPPDVKFDVIVARSALHFFKHGADFWETVVRHSKPDTSIFIVDLVRPRTVAGARESVLFGMPQGDPPQNRAMYLKGFLAASRFEEIREDLRNAGLEHVRMATHVMGRHIFIFHDGGRSSTAEHRVVAPDA